MKKSKTIMLKNTHAEQKWLDVVIDKKAKTVAVELRINVKDGGARGVGETPPDEVKKSPYYSKHTPKKHIRLKPFNDLKILVQTGIRRYWTRKITLKNGDVYTLSVLPKITTKHSMDDIALIYNTNRKWLRSSYPGKARGIVSFFGNIAPERIVYNVGWTENLNTNTNKWEWSYDTQAQADAEFMRLSAHETGHGILAAYGGTPYSYGHRGSSTIITQKRKNLKKGGFSYPSSGEIDLMKYYHGRTPRNYFNRVITSEQDVKSLLWIARIKSRE